MLNKIVDGLDLAERDQTFDENGEVSQAAWIIQLSGKQHRANALDTPYAGKLAKNEEAVEAFISTGKWSASCPVCGPAATEYVNAKEKIFYCFNCGNRALKGAARPVKFPPRAMRLNIESILMARPFDDSRGASLMDQATQARPKFNGLLRAWMPGVKVTELNKINKLYKIEEVS